MKAIGFLFLVVLVVGGVGFVLDWWSFSAESHAGETNLSLRVNKDKIGADTKAATAKIKKKTQELVEAIKKSGGEAASGTIIGHDDSSITVEREDGSVARFALGAMTSFELDDAPAGVGDLKMGDAVTVIDKDKDGTADRVIAASVD